MRKTIEVPQVQTVENNVESFEAKHVIKTTWGPKLKIVESSDAQHVRRTIEFPQLQTVETNVESSEAQHVRKTIEVPHLQICGEKR